MYTTVFQQYVWTVLQLFRSNAPYDLSHKAYESYAPPYGLPYASYENYGAYVYPAYAPYEKSVANAHPSYEKMW